MFSYKKIFKANNFSGNITNIYHIIKILYLFIMFTYMRRRGIARKKNRIKNIQLPTCSLFLSLCMCTCINIHTHSYTHFPNLSLNFYGSTCSISWLMIFSFLSLGFLISYNLVRLSLPSLLQHKLCSLSLTPHLLDCSCKVQYLFL